MTITGVTGSTVPRRAPDLIERDLPDGVLVFDPHRIRAHALNPSAAWVLSRCDGGADLDAIVAELAASVDQPGATLADDVRRVVDHLVGEGVLDAPGTVASVAAVEPARHLPNVPHSGTRVGREDTASAAAFTSPAYLGLSFRFRFATDDLDLAAYLTSILDPLALPSEVIDERDDPDVAGPEHRYDLRRPDGAGGDGLLALDGFVVSRPGTDHLLAATVLWHVNQMVSTTSRSYWQLHASGIVRDGRAVVFPASMNAGKSTLVAGLLRAGDAYLTDETIAITPGTGAVVPYPKAIALDPGSWPVLPDLEPILDLAHRPFEHQKWHVDPRATGAEVVSRAARPRVGAVLFPRHRPGAPTELEPIGPTEAAVELCRNSFNLAALGAVGIDAVTDLVRHVPCHRLVVGDLAAAVDLVHDHVDALAVPDPPDGGSR